MNVTRITKLDALARARAYAGEVLVLRGHSAALDLCTFFRSLKEDEKKKKGVAEEVAWTLFDGDASEVTFSQREKACKAFESNETVKTLFRRIFAEACVDGQTTCWDRPRLRIQQSGGGVDDILASSQFGQGKYSSTLPPHRDTWASNIMQQLNWWIPLEEIDEGRTMCFFPDLFEREVPNTSRDWDFHELRKRRKAGLPYPQLPELDLQALALEKNKEVRAMLEKAMDRPSSQGSSQADHSNSNSKSNAKPIVVDPGDVVIFSGAHLHASVVNTTGKTRYSCEIRSVHVLDYSQKKGAPNVDGRAPREPLHWFHCVDDPGRSLKDILV